MLASKLIFACKIFVFLWIFLSAASGTTAIAPSIPRTLTAALVRNSTLHSGFDSDIQTSPVLKRNLDISSDEDSSSSSTFNDYDTPANPNKPNWNSKRRKPTWISSNTVNNFDNSFTSSPGSYKSLVSNTETSISSILADILTKSIQSSLSSTNIQTGILHNPTFAKASSPRKDYSKSPTLSKKSDSSTIPTSPSSVHKKLTLANKITQRKTSDDFLTSNAASMPPEYNPAIICAGILSGAGAAAFLVAIVFYIQRTFATDKARAGTRSFTDAEINISAPPIQARYSTDIESLYLTDHMENSNADTNSIV